MTLSIQSTELVHAMMNPAFYPWRPERVELIETHISWLFLAGSFVVKVKRPVQFSFVDHSTLERRWKSCLDEVRLNRRLTDEVYLDVIPITLAGNEPRYGGAGKVVEWATLMRRMPADRMLDTLLIGGQTPEDLVESLAHHLIPFHLTGAEPCQGSAEKINRSVTTVLLDNLDELARLPESRIPPRTLSCIDGAMRAFLREDQVTLLQRARDGFVREGHGDLRCEHICIEQKTIHIFDCVEFNRSLRCADIASDLAFLLMDLDRLGQRGIARGLVERYVAAGIDLPRPLLNLYTSHRALVRAKIEVLSGGTEVIDYLGLALRAVTTFSPLMVVMTGLSGTGKSTVAHTIGQLLGAQVFVSDNIRKELAGVEGAAPSDWQTGIYTPAWSERTYDRLFECARESLTNGLPVVLDASFLTDDRRERAAAVALEMGAQLLIVETVCDDAVVAHRLERRQHEATTKSDADFRIHHQQRMASSFHPPGVPDGAIHFSVNTTSDSNAWIDQILGELIERGLAKPGIAESGTRLPED